MVDYLGLNDEQAGQMIKLLDRFDKLPRDAFDAQAREIIGDNADATDKLNQIIAVTSLDTLPDAVKNSDAVKPVIEVLDNLRQLGVNNAIYDPRLMRGFDYYTGIVFEAFDEAPENRRAMFGGGRYDGLVAMFGVETLPVVGAAPGETMFMEFLRVHNLTPELLPTVTTYVIPLIDEISVEKHVADLRQAGVNVAIDTTDRKMDKKMKAAVKQGAKWLIFIGEEEARSGQLQLKNVATGEQDRLSVEQIVAKVNG